MLLLVHKLRPGRARATILPVSGGAILRAIDSTTPIRDIIRAQVARVPVSLFAWLAVCINLLRKYHTRIAPRVRVRQSAYLTPSARVCLCVCSTAFYGTMSLRCVREMGFAHARCIYILYIHCFCARWSQILLRVVALAKQSKCTLHECAVIVLLVQDASTTERASKSDADAAAAVANAFPPIADNPWVLTFRVRATFGLGSGSCWHMIGNGGGGEEGMRRHVHVHGNVDGCFG